MWRHRRSEPEGTRVAPFTVKLNAVTSTAPATRSGGRVDVGRCARTRITFRRTGPPGYPDATTPFTVHGSEKACRSEHCPDSVRQRFVTDGTYVTGRLRSRAEMVRAQAPNVTSPPLPRAGAVDVTHLTYSECGDLAFLLAHYAGDANIALEARRSTDRNGQASTTTTLYPQRAHAVVTSVPIGTTCMIPVTVTAAGRRRRGMSILTGS